MPRRAPTRCTRCSQLATMGGRCDEHQRKPWETRSANSRTLNGQDRKRLRDAALRRDPRCSVCGDPVVDHLELDHIIEIADGGAAKDPSNTWLLCKPCHEAKTQHARKARAARRRRRG